MSGSESATYVPHEWVDAAAGWRKWLREFAEQSAEATRRVVEAVQVAPGMRVLDLASGCGEPAVSLAVAVSPGGGVVATDLVPGMLEGAREHAAWLGRGNLLFAAASADALPFPSGCFDRVTCRFGVMFFADVRRAMREVRRVLKPGGRAVFAAWGDSEHNTFYAATTAVLARHHASRPGPDQATRYAEPGSLSQVLRAAGFREVAEHFHTIAWPWPGPPEQFWQYSLDVRVSFRRVFETLPRANRESARQESLAEMSRSYSGRRVNFSAEIVIAAGVSV